jgi:hypothetical protein
MNTNSLITHQTIGESMDARLGLPRLWLKPAMGVLEFVSIRG